MSEEKGKYLGDRDESGSEVIAERHERFYMIPNIIEDMGLDLFEHRLYCHLKRITGENGRCFQNSVNMAEKCMMSAGKLTAAKRSLEQKGLIRIDAKPSGRGKPYHTIVIIDIWKKSIISPGEIITSPGDIKKTTVNKTLKHTNAAEAADPASLPVLEAPGMADDPLLHYPEALRPYIESVSNLLNVAIPRKVGKRGGAHAFWIMGARELMEACGEAGTDAIRKVYDEWCAEKIRLGRVPYDLASPRSFVNKARVAAGEILEYGKSEFKVDADGGFYV